MGRVDPGDRKREYYFLEGMTFPAETVISVVCLVSSVLSCYLPLYVCWILCVSSYLYTQCRSYARRRSRCWTALTLRPSLPLPRRLRSATARDALPRPGCSASRPRRVLRRLRPRPHPRLFALSEADSVWLSVFPTAPPPIRAPTSGSAARHRGRASPPRQTSAPPSGAAPAHRSVFAFHHFESSGLGWMRG